VSTASCKVQHLRITSMHFPQTYASKRYATLAMCNRCHYYATHKILITPFLQMPPLVVIDVSQYLQEI
jgi:hypothetical protein